MHQATRRICLLDLLSLYAFLHGFVMLHNRFLDVAILNVTFNPLEMLQLWVSSNLQWHVYGMCIYPEIQRVKWLYCFVLFYKSTLMSSSVYCKRLNMPRRHFNYAMSLSMCFFKKKYDISYKLLCCFVLCDTHCYVFRCEQCALCVFVVILVTLLSMLFVTSSSNSIKPLSWASLMLFQVW